MPTTDWSFLLGKALGVVGIHDNKLEMGGDVYHVLSMMEWVMISEEQRRREEINWITDVGDERKGILHNENIQDRGRESRLVQR